MKISDNYGAPFCTSSIPGIRKQLQMFWFNMKPNKEPNLNYIHNKNVATSTSYM